MTEAIGRPAVPFPDWIVRHSRGFVWAIHIPFVAAGPMFVLVRQDVGVPAGIGVVALALAIGALSVRHALGTARGVRPPGWPISLAAMLVLTYLPTVTYGFDWLIPAQWSVFASVAMLLPLRPAIVACTIGTLITAVVVYHSVRAAGGGADVAFYYDVYDVAIVVIGPAALWGSARFVHTLDELFRARTELADQAVGRERLRLSRDLHDLLGHSLSAVSLKGDLALRLLAADPPAAQAEIRGLTDVARDALRDMRAVAHDEHTVSLRSEIAAARAVLVATGITVQVDLELPPLAPEIDTVLAWSVREGATNVLRHSDATACTIRCRRSTDDRLCLEIVNDGVPTTTEGVGRGLAGIAERAAALHGRAAGARVATDGYRLLVEVPIAGAFV
jgi:two-component system sensor histidine kinase DesK